MDKRGVSGVITAVLLILLVISAVGVLWVVVSSFVTDQTDIGGSVGCLDTKMKVVSASASAVVIRKESGSAEIEEVLVYVNDVINDEEYSGDMAVGEIQSVTYSTGLTAGTHKISIAAKVGGQICDKSEELEITVP
tara:strand:+ start:74 stop:481 length:408 start_codon:yes stop_codon:yes gene_type:complete